MEDDLNAPGDTDDGLPVRVALPPKRNAPIAKQDEQPFPTALLTTELSPANLRPAARDDPPSIESSSELNPDRVVASAATAPSEASVTAKASVSAHGPAPISATGESSTSASVPIPALPASDAPLLWTLDEAERKEASAVRDVAALAAWVDKHRARTDAALGAGHRARVNARWQEAFASPFLPVLDARPGDKSFTVRVQHPELGAAFAKLFGFERADEFARERWFLQRLQAFRLDDQPIVPRLLHAWTATCPVRAWKHPALDEWKKPSYRMHILLMEPWEYDLSSTSARRLRTQLAHTADNPDFANPVPAPGSSSSTGSDSDIAQLLAPDEVVDTMRARLLTRDVFVRAFRLAHALGQLDIVHGDLKPDQFLLRRDPRTGAMLVVLTDFGYAGYAPGRAPPDAPPFVQTPRLGWMGNARHRELLGCQKIGSPIQAANAAEYNVLQLQLGIRLYSTIVRIDVKADANAEADAKTDAKRNPNAPMFAEFTGVRRKENKWPDAKTTECKNLRRVLGDRGGITISWSEIENARALPHEKAEASWVWAWRRRAETLR
jgi:hypothetical protein